MGDIGLLHDLDFDYVNKDPNKHGYEIVKILQKEIVNYLKKYYMP
jgi:predicted hydrolase (HD superfamily)